MENKFFICRHCGNLAKMIKNSGVPMMCCGQKMEALVPNTVDASGEKHLPVVTLTDGGIKVNVGSIAHPMTAEHFIEWIYVQTENGGRRINLTPDTAPEITICTCGDKVTAVYAYCNLHGLWMTEVK